GRDGIDVRPGVRGPFRMAGAGCVEADRQGDLPAVDLQDRWIPAGHEEILLRSVQVRFEAGLDGACWMDREGGQPRRTVRVFERGTDHGGYSGAPADFPDAVQPPVSRAQPLPGSVQQV